MPKTEYFATAREEQDMDQMLMASGSKRKQESLEATEGLAKALELPLRKGVLSGDILGNIYETIRLRENATAEFPLDFIAPGTEKEFVAFTIPNHGYIPQRHVEGDYVMIPTYDIGASIDWNLKYARDARWDIMDRAMETMEAEFVKKLNDDGWHTLLTAGVDRNIVILDSDAPAGFFTKRLVSLMKLVMRRNGGGNSSSNNRGRLTDLYLSPEGLEDIRNWNVDQVDEMTRNLIFNAPGDNALNRIFNVNLHDIDELGEGQEYQLYYTNELSGTLPGSKTEIVVGLDQSRRDSFVMPVRELPEIFVDDNLHRMKRAGLYGWAEQGFGVLDNRRVLVGAF